MRTSKNMCFFMKILKEKEKFEYFLRVEKSN